MKELLLSLRYYQSRYRIEYKGMERTKERILEIARQMRAEQGNKK